MFLFILVFSVFITIHLVVIFYVAHVNNGAPFAFDASRKYAPLTEARYEIE